MITNVEVLKGFIPSSMQTTINSTTYLPFEGGRQPLNAAADSSKSPLPTLFRMLLMLPKMRSDMCVKFWQKPMKTV
jgi:hypothetical protein